MILMRCDERRSNLASCERRREGSSLHGETARSRGCMAVNPAKILFWLAMVATLTSACSTDRIVTKVETVEVKVPVPVHCPAPAVGIPDEPDLAPADLDDWAVSQWIRVRLIDLRTALNAYVAHASACAGADEE